MISFDTTFLDYPSPDDIAVVVIMSGCEHNCIGCQNPALQQLHNNWKSKQIETFVEEIHNICKRNDTNKIVLSGGDPLHPCNRDLSSAICNILGATHDICIYTGYTDSEVKTMNLRGFKYIKCGTFDCTHLQKSEKTDSYIQFVNSSQNLFDSDFKQVSKDGRFYFNNGVKHE